MSGTGDKIEGAWDTAKGKAKKIVGEITNDDSKKTEGSLDKLKGSLKDTKGDIKNKINDL